MFGIYYLILIAAIYNINYVHSLSNSTLNKLPETLSNLTSENDLWSSLLKYCMPPTFSCIRKHIYEYLRNTLDHPNDIQFTNFLKFPKNSINYDKEILLQNDTNMTNPAPMAFDNDVPIEDMSRSLAENTRKFFVTHDIQLQLPETFFLGTTMKISPKSFEENGATVKLEIIPKSIKDSVGEGRLFFKKIRKFISERLVYALLAILLVIKLLAVKFLFILPTIVGVAAAKKLLLKVLLFIFPALHHLFKLCAYTPYGAKHHIHKHQISHIHEVGHSHHHPGSSHKEYDYVEADSPPHPYHHSDVHRDYMEPSKTFDHGHIKSPWLGNKNDIHRKDLGLESNDIGIRSQGPTKHESRRPLTPMEIKNMILIAEREAELKKYLYKQRQKIQEENSRLQEQLSNAMKIQQKLKQQAVLLHNYKAMQNVNNTHSISYLQNPQEHLSTNVLPYGAQIPIAFQPQSPLSIPNKLQSSHNIQENMDIKTYHNSNNIVDSESLPFKGDVYKAATVTYDPFYSPILVKIDKVLEVFGMNEEPCKERLICNMYKDPAKFSPHSNLLSVELSRDSKDLQKPTSTNAAIIRFYRYVQAARDGQDRKDCERMYPACSVNTVMK